MDTTRKINQVGVNIQEKAAVIWNVANSLFGAYKPHEYGLVILPPSPFAWRPDFLAAPREAH